MTATVSLKKAPTTAHEVEEYDMEEKAFDLAVQVGSAVMDPMMMQMAESYALREGIAWPPTQESATA